MILLPLPFTPQALELQAHVTTHSSYMGGGDVNLSWMLLSQAHSYPLSKLTNSRVFPFDGPHGLSIHQLQTSSLSSNKHPSRFLLEFLSWFPVTTASVGVAGRCSRSHRMTGNLIGKQPRPLSIQDRFLATGSSPPASTI